MRIVLTLTGLSFLLANSTVAAATIQVPADQPTIQDAINIAVNGDVVRVAAGTYTENIDFSGKDIVVESATGAATTIIDGSGVDSGVRFSGGETRSAVLRGFTVTNGFASEGGGILVLNASPTIENNVVTANVACAGAGIGLGFAAPLISNNEITANVQGGCSGGIGGGGISVRGADQAEIYDNLIADNVSTDGAGISLFASGSPRIARNEITRNQGATQGGGIKMVNQSDVFIVNNVIHGNSASEGAAIYWLIPQSTPIVRFNTIFENSAPNGATIYADGFDGLGEVTSNIIIAPDGGTAIFCGTFNDLNNPLLAANNVLAPGGTLYAGNCTDQTGIDGNLSQDPAFVDLAGADLRLLPGSPMIDNAVEDPAVTDDFLSNTRPVDGDGDQVAISDIGAYEATPPVANAGADVTIAANGAGSLNAAGSSDADGVIVSYQWMQVGGTAVTLSNNQVAAPTFTAPGAAATLVFELTVTDDLGFTGTDQVSITVTAPPPPPPPPSGGGGGSLDPLTIVLLLPVAAISLLRRRRSVSDGIKVNESQPDSAGLQRSGQEPGAKAMKSNFNYPTIAVVALVFCSAAFAQDELPVPGYGAAQDLEGSLLQPDPNAEYKVVFDASKAAANVDDVNPMLDLVARYVNTLAKWGVPAEKRKIAVVMHQGSGLIGLKNEAFKARNDGHDNPNIELIRSLHAAGVSFHLCGQGVLARKIDPEDLLPEIQVDLWALTSLIEFGRQGYIRIGG